VTAPAPLSGSPRWVEPEGTPEQIADACVAHLAAGGRVDIWTEWGAWWPSAYAYREDFARRVTVGDRFALVYSDPPQPERHPPPRRGLEDIGDGWAQPTRVDPPEGVTPDVRRQQWQQPLDCPSCGLWWAHGKIETTGEAHQGGGYHRVCHHCEWEWDDAFFSHGYRDTARRVVKVADGPSVRVPTPEGVTVIGWTEPTDDEPALPLYNANSLVPDGWYIASPPVQVVAIRPTPSPPVPETERRWFTVEVTGLPESVDDGLVRAELASTISRLHNGAGGAGLTVGTSGGTKRHPDLAAAWDLLYDDGFPDSPYQSGALRVEMDRIVGLLPLDGTDGD
jgi:hypothetical protein